MSYANQEQPNIRIPVDLTNTGQFFACCGLLELADRAEGWFQDSCFCITHSASFNIKSMLAPLIDSTVANTMTPEQLSRFNELSAMSKKQRLETPGLEDEKKLLEASRRELPILLCGSIQFRIDWFLDDDSGGSRFKTWAGQQSVLGIASAMHTGMRSAGVDSELTLWNNARGVGLPFNFDSDLGGQGSALDIGFSFDPLRARPH